MVSSGPWQMVSIRISFRRAMKKALLITMEQGADGIRVRCAGRLGGAEISRAEWHREGKIPLHTLRVPIDYGFAEARRKRSAAEYLNSVPTRGRKAFPKVSHGQG